MRGCSRAAMNGRPPSISSRKPHIYVLIGHISMSRRKLFRQYCRNLLSVESSQFSIQLGPIGVPVVLPSKNTGKNFDLIGSPRVVFIGGFYRGTAAIQISLADSVSRQFFWQRITTTAYGCAWTFTKSR